MPVALRWLTCSVLLPALLATPAFPSFAQAPRVELDHVFIVVNPGAVDALRALRSQGTASVAVLFENAYLELIWVDSSVSVAPDHAATARWFRRAAAWRTTGQSPFGLGLRRMPGDTAALPVPVERELAPWLGPGAAYELLHQPADSLATDFFVVPARAALPAWIARERDRAPEELRHPGGGRRITLVRVLGPADQEPIAFGRLRPTPIEMIRAAEPVLEVHLDNDARGQRVDLRPSLPLIIVR
jgi:hypothetical protein